MERRYTPLAKRCDRDAVFALNYLRTTEVFAQTLDEVNYNEPASVIREDALFAEYYFRADDAYRAGKGNVPPVWQIAFDAAQNRSVSGAGNIALGINAHIQRDLPFVLYELYLKGRPVSYEDHTRVNDFLQQVNPLKELAEKFDPAIDDQDVPGEAAFFGVFWERSFAGESFKIYSDESDKRAIVGRFHFEKVWARDLWHLTSQLNRKLLAHTVCLWLNRYHPEPLHFEQLLAQ